MEELSLRLASFLAAVLGTALYLNTLDLGFCFDDLPAIVNNKDLRPSTPWANIFENDFWGAPMSHVASHKSYRPLTVATFRLNYVFHELDKTGYHLVNAVIHGLVSGVFVVFTNVALENTCTSLLAGLLFAAHPLHTEAVAGLVGRAEGLCSLCFMAAFLAYVKAVGKSTTDFKWLLACLLGTVAAVLCKELGVTVAGVCIVYDLFALQKVSLPFLLDTLRRGRRPAWLLSSSFLIRLVIMSGAVAVIMALRIHIMKNVPVFLPFDNPPAFEGTPVRQLTQLHLVFVNAWLLLCPAGLLADWSMGTVPLVRGVGDVRNLQTLLTLALLAAVGATAVMGTGRRNRILVLAVAMLAIPFLPASNLLFSVGFVVAERILYIPSMGFCVLVAFGMECLMQNRRLRHLLYVTFLALICLFSMKTIIRNYQWDSDFTIFTSALKVTQSNAKVYSNIGHHYENLGELQMADKYFSQSVIVQPNDIGAWMNVGRISKALKNRTRAIKAYRTAIGHMPDLAPGAKVRVAPSHLKVYVKLANILKEHREDYQAAVEMFTAALSVDASNVEAHNGFAEMLRELGRYEESRIRIQKALAIDPNNYISYFHLAVLGLKRGNERDAERYFKKVVQLDPTHSNAFYNLGILYHNHKRLPEAMENMKRVLSLKPSHVGATFTLGVVLLDSRLPVEALEYFNKTIQLDPKHQDALFNSALTLNTLQRLDEAEASVRHFLQLYPRHLKGRLLVGDINAHQKNFKEALKWYDAALEVKADSTVAMHNKAVMLVNLNRLPEAVHWLEQLVELQPGYPKGKENLATLRKQLAEQQPKGAS